MPPGRKPLPTGYNLTDLKLAVGYVLLGSWEKAAEFAGMEKRNSSYHRIKNKEFIDEVIETVNLCMMLRRRESPEISVEKQVERLSGLYGKAIAVAEEALDRGDRVTALSVITEAIDRNHGKARQTMKVEGEVRQVHELPPAVSAAINSLGALLSQGSQLYTLPPVLELSEADVVADSRD